MVFPFCLSRRMISASNRMDMYGQLDSDRTINSPEDALLLIKSQTLQILNGQLTRKYALIISQDGIVGAPFDGHKHQGHTVGDVGESQTILSETAFRTSSKVKKPKATCHHNKHTTFCHPAPALQSSLSMFFSISAWTLSQSSRPHAADELIEHGQHGNLPSLGILKMFHTCGHSYHSIQEVPNTRSLRQFLYCNHRNVQIAARQWGGF